MRIAGGPRMVCAARGPETSHTARWPRDRARTQRLDNEILRIDANVLTDINTEKRRRRRVFRWRPRSQRRKWGRGLPGAEMNLTLRMSMPETRASRGRPTLRSTVTSPHRSRMPVEKRLTGGGSRGHRGSRRGQVGRWGRAARIHEQFEATLKDRTDMSLSGVPAQEVGLQACSRRGEKGRSTSAGGLRTRSGRVEP